MVEDLVEPAGHGAAHDLVGGERLQRRTEAVGDLLDLGALLEQVIRVALLRRPRVDLPAHAVQAGAQLSQVLTTSEVAGREFIWTDNGWIQKGLEGQTPVTRVDAGSPQGRALLTKYSDLEFLLADGSAVVLRYNLETVDNHNIDRKLGAAPLRTQWRRDLLGGVVTISGQWTDGTEFLAIPNYARMNRLGPPHAYPREEEVDSGSSTTEIVSSTSKYPKKPSVESKVWV